MLFILKFYAAHAALCRITLAIFVGALIGTERELRGKSVGIRTMSIISMAACLLTILSITIPGADPSRIAAQIVPGAGFLCAG